MTSVVTLEKSSGGKPPIDKAIASGFADDDEQKKVKSLSNKVANLTLKQAAQLARYLREKLRK